MTTLPTTPTREEGRDLINSVIVDTFIKAVREYGDNKSSYREDIRYGLTKIAPLIVARSTLTKENARLAERVRVLEGTLEQVDRQAHIAMKYAENERKIATASTTMEFQVQHIIDIVKPFRSALSQKDGE